MKKNEEMMYISSVRHALGRRTYIVDVTIEWIMRENLSEKCKEIMIRDIEECKDYGMDCDKEDWMRLLNHLKK